MLQQNLNANSRIISIIEDRIGDSGNCPWTLGFGSTICCMVCAVNLVGTTQSLHFFRLSRMPLYKQSTV